MDAYADKFSPRVLLFRRLETSLLVLFIPLYFAYGLVVWYLPPIDASTPKLFQHDVSARWPWLVLLGYLIAWCLWLALVVIVNTTIARLTSSPRRSHLHLILALSMFIGCSIFDILPYSSVAPEQVVWCLLLTFVAALGWVIYLNRGKGAVSLDLRYMILATFVWLSSLVVHFWLSKMAIGIAVG